MIVSNCAVILFLFFFKPVLLIDDSPEIKEQLRY